MNESDEEEYDDLVGESVHNEVDIVTSLKIVLASAEIGALVNAQKFGSESGEAVLREVKRVKKILGV